MVEVFWALLSSRQDGKHPETHHYLKNGEEKGELGIGWISASRSSHLPKVAKFKDWSKCQMSE